MANTASHTLPARELHVWIADVDHVDSQRLFERYYPVLDANERDRYHRFHFDPDRQLFLASHALLRMSLSHYGSCHPEQWQFVRDSYGKPELAPDAGLPPLRFNLSHTHGMAACVVGLEPCGIDVERIRPMNDMRSLATMVCSDAELAHLNTLGGDDLAEQFFALWTLKEAYLKATGTGMSTPPGQIGFALQASRICPSFGTQITDDPARWLFERFHPDATHRIAVAACPRDNIEAIVWQKLDLNSSGAIGLRRTTHAVR